MSLFRRKPHPEPVDYVGLVQEAESARARSVRLAADARVAAEGRDLVRLHEINAALRVEVERMREIAVQIGAVAA